MKFLASLLAVLALASCEAEPAYAQFTSDQSVQAPLGGHSVSQYLTNGPTDGHAVTITDAVMTAGSPNITTVSSTPFNCATDVGKPIAVALVGATNASAVNQNGTALKLALVSTIKSCSANNAAVLNANASFNTQTGGNWATLGYDDTAAIRNCVNAAIADGPGGRCTITNGDVFMVSNSDTAIYIQSATGINGLTIDGGGTIIVAPTGSDVGGVNDRLFYPVSYCGTPPCTIGGSSPEYSIPLEIASAIAKGATSFTMTNSGDAATLTKGERIIITERYVNGSIGGIYLTDWATVASVSGTTVTVVEPFRMAFPDQESWTGSPLYGGLSLVAVPSPTKHVTFRDFKLVIPNINNSTDGLFGVMGIETQMTEDTVIDNVTIENASYGPIATEYDHNLQVINNHWNLNGIASEIASTSGIQIHNNFINDRPSALNGYQDSCTGQINGELFLLDGGTAFGDFSGNTFDYGCLYAIGAYQGVHDLSIHDNAVGYLANGTTGYNAIAINLGGAQRIIMHDNVFAGGAGSASIAIACADETTPNSKCDANFTYDNHANEITTDFTGTLYDFLGSLGTDCAIYKTQETNDIIDTCNRYMPGANQFGSITIPVLDQDFLTPSTSAGEIVLGNVTGITSSIFCTLYSSDGACIAYNAKYVAEGCDCWQQLQGGLISYLTALTPVSGLVLYTSAANGARPLGYQAGTTVTLASGSGVAAGDMLIPPAGGGVPTTLLSGSGTSWTADVSQTYGSSGSKVAMDIVPPYMATGTYTLSGTTATLTVTAGWVEAGMTFNVTGNSNVVTIGSLGTSTGRNGTVTLSGTLTNVPASGSFVLYVPFSQYWGSATWTASLNANVSGTPTTSSLAEWASATALETGNLSGDATTSGSMAVTVVKENGHAFPTSATSGDVATTASNGLYQDSGTLLSALAPLASPNFTGVLTNTGSGVFGNTACIGIGGSSCAAPFEIVGNGSPYAEFNLVQYHNDTVGTYIIGFKSNATTTGGIGSAAVAAGQGLLTLAGYGDDGHTAGGTPAAEISLHANTTIASGIVSGAIAFHVWNSSGVFETPFSIDDASNLCWGTDVSSADCPAADIIVAGSGGTIGNSSRPSAASIATANLRAAGTLYSAAGTALPTCNSGAKGEQAVVSDATTPTFLATYTSGGAVVAPVMCNGSNWVTY